MNDILFLKGDFKEKIWGSDRLEDFGLDIPSHKTGEYWAISGMEGESSIITNGDLRGKSLREVYKAYPELFGNPTEDDFPLLVKLIDAGDDLSIQVHPDDSMGKELENSRGKTECWYVLNEEPASLIYGLKVDSKDEALRLIDERRWDELLREVPTTKGDFFFVRAGTVHAIKKGSIILEIQQASDITYRLYDYDRKDDEGKLRDLHIEKSKAAIKTYEEENKEKNISHETYEERLLTENEYFAVREFKIKSRTELKKDAPYLLESVVGGSGQIRTQDKTYDIKKGDFFILTSKLDEYIFEGDLTIVESRSFL